MRIWGVPLAGGLLLWLITALAGPRNLSKNLHQNIANEWMNNAVQLSSTSKKEICFYFATFQKGDSSDILWGPPEQGRAHCRHHSRGGHHLRPRLLEVHRLMSFTDLSA